MPVILPVAGATVGVPSAHVLPWVNIFGLYISDGSFALAQQSEVVGLKDRVRYHGTIVHCSDDRIAHGLQECLKQE